MFSQLDCRAALISNSSKPKNDSTVFSLTNIFSFKIWYKTVCVKKSQKKSSDKTPNGDTHGEKQCKQMEIFGRQVEFPFQRDVQLENYARGNGLPLNWALMPIYKMLISYLDKDGKPKSANPLTLSDSGSSCTFVSDQIMSRAQILGHWQVVKNLSCN